MGPAMVTLSPKGVWGTFDSVVQFLKNLCFTEYQNMWEERVGVEIKRHQN